ncbi:lipase family protein [Zavarzinia sp. CC-PAN008]|uniref:lipase family protein n=1 Tax=Zavarzinia sp. CC-PAN008 TaxID=3243332 RepID=UPI003F7470BA
MARSRKARGLAARLVRAAMWSVLALALLAGAAWLYARPSEPDDFYRADLPTDALPGSLLKAEAFVRDVPAGARGWRILYVTTRLDGRAALASALVLIKGPSQGARPVVAWAHGTTGVAPGCAPSVLAHPFNLVPALGAALDAGWAVVATDYVGLGTDGGHAYLVGDEAGRSVLDAVRAAAQVPEAATGEAVVIWGHSQGGNSALWAGIRASAQPAGLDLKGVAALAPASDLPQLVLRSQGSMFGKIVSSYLIHAYAATYPDVVVGDYVGGWSSLLVGDIASRCAGGLETLVSAAETVLLPKPGIFAKAPDQGPLGARLAENVPAAPIAAPVLVAQGALDDLVLPAISRDYVRARCAAGQAIDHRVYPGLDHVTLVAPGSPLDPDLIAWTADRFAGRPAAGCPSD